MSDLKVKVSLYMARESAILSQHFENLTIVVNKALGGEKKKEVQKPKSFADAQAQFNSLFG